MTMKKASENARTAVNALQAIGSICADLAPLDMPMTDEQIRQRADLIRSVIKTRQQMLQFRDRAKALGEALERFRTRQEEIRSKVA
ncbi:hypothetical protein [Dokdonella immobilis]|uniref:Uncharacterized protein n=1 Tax=Dokdonella immobilis TaxID=578942 RepID=A0A1I4ZW40_9GAMM|nr:hypothetical protein [Dokdonella immobilis]SFN54446.1 hypothetical protein SAMN05216289_12956 [Dokdonella immobilis]